MIFSLNFLFDQPNTTSYCAFQSRYCKLITRLKSVNDQSITGSNVCRHSDDNAVVVVGAEGGRARQAGRRAVAVPVGRGARPPRPRHRRHAGLQQPRRAHAHAHQHIRAGDQGAFLYHLLLTKYCNMLLYIINETIASFYM